MLKASPKSLALIILTHLYQLPSLHQFRTVLAIAAARDFEIHQINIKDAYLNRKLNQNKVIYMQQPLGFMDPKQSLSVYHLEKTLYGLK